MKRRLINVGHYPALDEPAYAPQLRYMPWMDGMRAIAVLSVMAYHEALFASNNNRIADFLPAGMLGVDIFFAISGFLITTLLLQEMRDRGSIGFGAFYLRRARRLLPALLTMLLVVTACGVVFDSGPQLDRLVVNAGLSLGYVANWVPALTAHNMAGLGHTWSLATEEQFYLVWPLLLTGLLALGLRRRKLVGVLAVIAAALAVWPQVGVSRHWSGARLAYGLDTRGAGLALGAVLGAAFAHGVLPRARAVTVARRVGAVVGVAAIAYLMHDATAFAGIGRRLGIDPRRFVFEEYAIASAVTVVLIWELVDSTPNVAHRVLSWKPLVWIGRISYGLYLWDAPVVYAFRLSNHGVRQASLMVAAHFALVLGAATLSFYMVESRFRRPRRPLLRGRVAVHVVRVEDWRPTRPALLGKRSRSGGSR